MDKEPTVRLSCPTCDAVYEIPMGAIASGGRDVQCSNCGTVWFQPLDGPPAPPSSAHLERHHDPVGQPAEGDDADEPPAGHDGPRPPLSAESRRILVEEAERERRLRAGAATDSAARAETEAAVDSMLEEGIGVRREARHDLGRPAPSDPRADGRAGRDMTDATPAPARPSRRDRLPDIAEINSSLDAGGDMPPADPDDEGVTRGGSGFRLGFAVALLIAAIGLVLYVQGSRIGAAVPSLREPLGAYRDGVNDVRIALDGFARRVADTLDP